MTKKINHHPLGLTLIELTVTVSLVVVMLSISSLAYRQANKRLEIVLTGHNIASTMRLAESYAASAKELNNDPKKNAWGLFVSQANPNRVIMFNDGNNDGCYNEGEAYRTIAFGRQISLNGFFYLNKNNGVWDRETLEAQDLTILFLPPDPKVKIWANCGAVQVGYNNAVINIKDSLNSSVKDISINQFGLVDSR